MHVGISISILVFSQFIREVKTQFYQCPEGWDTFGQRCYQFNFYPYQNYVGAKEACGLNGAALLSVNDRNEHNFIGQWLIIHDQSAYRWFTSGIIYDLQSNDLRWEGDGTVIAADARYWLNQGELDKPGQHIVYTYGVFEYLWGREPSSSLLPYICEIGQEEAYRVIQEERDFDYGEETSDPNVLPRGPNILIHPQSLVAVGRATTASLECVAVGNPMPTYKIIRTYESGDVTVVTSTTDVRYTLTNGLLTIQHPNETVDAGRYHCEIENRFGKVLTNEMTLSFGMLAEFSNIPREPVLADSYQWAVIECRPPVHKPAISYAWYKGTSHFVRPDLNPHIFISRNGRLYFSEVSRVDEGEYRCVTKLASYNGAAIGTNQPPSRTSLPIELIVQNAVSSEWGPEISNDFIAVFPSTPMIGNTIHLECLAFGIIPISYNWERIGLPIPPKATLSDHNRVLTIPDVEVEDGGVYVCHARRASVAFTHKNFTLELEGKPFFSYPLRNQHMDIGAQLTWRCEATARPQPTYEWYKNGIKLMSIPGQMTVFRNVLTIPSLDPVRDNGMYQCAARNIHGRTFSEAQLRVLGFKPTFHKNPLPEKLHGGVQGNITIICDPEAAPAPTYKWLKNGMDLGLNVGDTTSRIRLLQNGNLVITNINPGDVGSYTCHVENQFGADASTTQLVITTKTTIVVPPLPTMVKINNTAFLQCQASVSQYQDYIYTWSFNGQEIDIAKDYHFVQGTYQTVPGLYIRQADIRHSGYYECSAKTTQDSASAGAYLTVEGPPGEPGHVFAATGSITATSMRITWSVGADNGRAILFYIVEGKPDITTDWLIVIPYVADSAGVVPGGDPKKRSAIVERLNPGTGYHFRVKAVNVVGVGRPSAVSYIYQTLDAPPITAPSDVGGGGGSVGDITVTWKPLEIYEEGGPGIGYVVYWRRRGTDLWSKVKLSGRVGKYVSQFTTPSLYYTPYEAMVHAYNKHGDGPNSTIVPFFSAEDMPVGVVQNIKSYRYNSTAIMVTWDPVENTREIMKGTLMGYQVNYWERNQTNPILNSISWRVELPQGLIIGLLPDTWYSFTVQCFNTAGLNPLSTAQYQRTFKRSPILYPTEVDVSSHGSQSVYVTWRGVSTGANEEPLQGYKIWHWVVGDDIRTAEETSVEKVDNAVIYGIQKNNLYMLRVLAYNRGGDGTPSKTMYFTLGGLIPVDPEVSEIRASATQTSTHTLLIACALLCNLSIMQW